MGSVKPCPRSRVTPSDFREGRESTRADHDHDAGRGLESGVKWGRPAMIRGPWLDWERRNVPGSEFDLRDAERIINFTRPL